MIFSVMGAADALALAEAEADADAAVSVLLAEAEAAEEPDVLVVAAQAHSAKSSVQASRAAMTFFIFLSSIYKFLAGLFYLSDKKGPPILLRMCLFENRTFL